MSTSSLGKNFLNWYCRKVDFFVMEFRKNVNCSYVFNKILSYLSAESTNIFAMLSYFHLFDGFSQWSTITGTVFTDDSNLLGSLGLKNVKKKNYLTFRTNSLNVNKQFLQDYIYKKYIIYVSKSHQIICKIKPWPWVGLWKSDGLDILRF